MSCGCGNNSCNGRCHCGSAPCGQCDPCNDQDSYAVCLGRQIETLKSRTDQLWQQIDELNLGDSFPALCQIQTCNSPDCANTGTSCGSSPTGRPVGSGSGNSCCGQDNPANLNDRVDRLANEVRKLCKDQARLDKLVCELRKIALRTVLLDNAGNARGGIAVNGDLKNFQIGSWELATS